MKNLLICFVFLLLAACSKETFQGKARDFEGQIVHFESKEILIVSIPGERGYYAFLTEDYTGGAPDGFENFGYMGNVVVFETELTVECVAETLLARNAK